jgi:transcriptional regulator with XRE-family HTH domain
MSVKSPDPVDAAVSRNIRIYRLARGMSQTTLAAGLGLTFQQVQKYENGSNRIGSGRLVRIATILDVPVATLLGSAGGSSWANGQTALELLADRQRFQLLQAFADIEAAAVRNAVVKLVDRLARRSRRVGG